MSTDCLLVTSRNSAIKAALIVNTIVLCIGFIAGFSTAVVLIARYA